MEKRFSIDFNGRISQQGIAEPQVSMTSSIWHGSVKSMKSMENLFSNMLFALIYYCFGFIRPPEGRAYVLPVMYLSFFSPRVLRAPSTDRPETLPRGRNLAVFYNPTPKIRGALPPKNLGAKNMQNFGQFWTTSDFDREYLRNGSRYPKLES